MESASVAAGHAAHDEHHGPPAANVSSRVEAQFLGMLLFIISEIMLFGAFFTAYFFIRVVAGDGWFPIDGIGPAEGDRRREHRDPGLVELHDALGARGRAQREPQRAPGRAPHHRAARAHLPHGPGERVRAHRLRAAATTRRGRSSTGSPGCTALTSSSGSRCSRSPRSAPSAATSRRRSTAASRCRASTGTSST